MSKPLKTNHNKRHTRHHRLSAISHQPSAVRFTIITLIVLILAIPTSSISAHANLLRSQPPLGAALSKSPESILLEFSEALDPGFSEVRLVNGASEIVVPGPGVVDAETPAVMTLAVPPLPDGVYSAVWKARSAVDGHITYGTLGFSVGPNTARVSLLPPPGTPDPATALPDTADTLSRWLSYLATAIAAGSIFFGLLIWRPASHGPGGGASAQTHAFVTWILRRLALIGLGGLAIGTLAFALSAAAQASGKPFLEVFGPPVATFAMTRTGLLLEARLALIALMAALIFWRLPSIDSDRGGIWWLLAALAAGVMVTFSLQSHAAAAESTVGIILDTFHLLAMSTWLGALLPLAVLLRAGRRGRIDLLPLDVLVPRFSLVALVSVGVLATTGVYSYFTQVQTLDALIATTYGQALIVKVALVAILIGLGAINLLLITPRLVSAASARDSGKSLRRTTAIELGIGLVVMLVAGVLTATPPATSSLEAQRRLGFLESIETDQVRLTFRVAPVQVGDNEFAVDIVDRRPGADAIKPEVLLRMGVSGGGLGLNQVEAVPTGAGRYTARGTFITLPGQWEVDVILRRPNYDDVVHRFTLDVGTRSPLTLSQEDQTPNPVQPDARSISAGKELYTTNCVPCHGVTGLGDGPVGLTLNPRPADLTVHTEPGVHTDGQLYKWISEGYPGSTMPEFNKYLSETERWDIVNYIRTLAKPMP